MPISYRIVLIGLACLFALVVGWGIATLTNPGLPAVTSFTPAPTVPVRAPTPQAEVPTAFTAPTEQATVQPTSAPNPEPTTTPTVATAAPTMRERVTQIMAPLRTGQLVAKINYSDNAFASADAIFDLGDAGQGPNVLLISEYKNESGSQTNERMLVGNQTWLRSDEGTWVLDTTPNHIVHEVQSLLPNPATIDAEKLVTDDRELQWYDAGQDIDVTLRIDSRNKLPYEMRQSFRSTGLVRIIQYQNWNDPVSLEPPEE